MSALRLREKASCRWDCVALGEVMLRLDPGEGRIATARQFAAWEGGGEYNVVRGLSHCFGHATAIVTALVDNAVGRLIEDLIRQGGVDRSHLRWVPHDGVGRTARNGLNFTERGFGARGALGCSDRGHTAVSQLRSGDVDWERIFRDEGARWFHTGGIFCALSETTPQVAREAMQAASRQGAIVSFDANYRESLWRHRGGGEAAREMTRAMAPFADVLLGVEDLADFPDHAVVAATRRTVHSASRQRWGAACRVAGELYHAPVRDNLEVLDRVGSGDAFAAGFIHGFLSGQPAQYAIDCGAAHGALAMTTPGDQSMATLAEVEALMRGAGAGAAR